MKILHVHDYFAPGNSRYGFDMNRLLVARGHEVHILTGVGELGPEDGSVLQGVVFHTYSYAHKRNGISKYRYAKKQNAENFGRLHQVCVNGKEGSGSLAMLGQDDESAECLREFLEELRPVNGFRPRFRVLQNNASALLGVFVFVG